MGENGDYLYFSSILKLEPVQPVHKSFPKQSVVQAKYQYAARECGRNFTLFKISSPGLEDSDQLKRSSNIFPKVPHSFLTFQDLVPLIGEQ